MQLIKIVKDMEENEVLWDSETDIEWDSESSSIEWDQV